ncbi:NAD(P)-dependent oxidoreductase [Gillisia limnaea]|uniref:Saccharopine dehydrogenase [NAD(+), L-lysine-forming] n=1 Tax=Gillisia limnaea (strain DSM 15749 / LMG 21470 / R-8282) TaxID=865937 RepID=H2BUP0_GILLR|nr:NAD(P)-dependent oxidoreductase [Gillisia limnaea]EHQ01695.1 alanine dehydrogenase/PNT domain protein [Gillisia limnaea DSM 15749]
MIKFAIIKERKTPPDRRVVFSHEKLKEVVQKFTEASFKIESSAIRVFTDDEYREAGFEVSEDVSNCDVMLGVKEVPIPDLIPNKKYFFFSHTIKKQPYNQDLLRAILKNNIELYDHEVIVKENGHRLIGFGRYAGLVGAYNGFRALGLRDGLFDLSKAENLADLKSMLAELDKIEIPPRKILLSGSGKVGLGAKEILDHLKIKQVDVSNYLNIEYNESVYCIIDVMDYNKRLDGGKGSIRDFYNHPEKYASNFKRFAHVTNMYIAGHFYGDGAPKFFTREDAASPDFKIDLIADISCDINGPIASTIRPSTIAYPFYGYDPQTGGEVDFRQKGAITVMAVDNLPCELPKDASEGFGEMFLKQVIPAFFNGDKNGILKRAKMTENGKLTARFQYLQDFVNDIPKTNEYV